MGAKMTAWVSQTHKRESGAILNVPNPQMRKKYDLPTNEKKFKKMSKGCQNDCKDVPGPEMRMRHQFGRPNTTNEKKTRFPHK